MNPPFKEGQIWRSNNPEHHGWCRHGLMRIESKDNGELYAVDTYWGKYSGERRTYKPEVIASDLEFVIDLTECRKSHKDEYERYAVADRAYIPMGGGSEQYFVRIEAKPDSTLVRDQLEAKAKNLRGDIEWNTRQLAEIEAKLAEMAVAK
jgi:hypothetical protein